MDDEEGYVRNCLFRLPNDYEGPPLFERTTDGHVIVRLDGMAIVPKAEYEELLSFKEKHVAPPEKGE